MITASALGLSGPIGARPVRSRDLLAWSRRMDRAARRGRRDVWLCLLVGLVFDAAVVGGCVAVGAAVRRPLHLPYAADAALLGGAVCLMMLPLAVVTKPEGRAEAASRLVNQGFHSGRHPGGNPVVGIGAAVLMLVALYGSFAVVEVARRTLARWKVSRASHDECVRLLATVYAAQAGVPIRSLLKFGQSPDTLRRPVAALILDGWVELADAGRVLQQRSPTRRRLAFRHPLADVFGV